MLSMAKAFAIHEHNMVAFESPDQLPQILPALIMEYP